MTHDEDTECPHGLGERAWCQLCNGKAEAARKLQAEHDEEKRFTTARFSGVCFVCGGHFMVGDEIGRKLGDLRGFWSHRECV